MADKHEKQNGVKSSGQATKNSQAKQKITGAEKEQHGPFKKKRGGQVLTKDEVKEIKQGRKKLRRDLRAQGIKSKKEFELTASSLGLYFDKNRKFALLWWFLGKWGIVCLLGLAGALVLTLWGFSYVTQLQGHFTISMSDKLFRVGFVLSEEDSFKNPTSHLFATPVENAPCISIVDIPENEEDILAHEKGFFFADTFYIKNEGEAISNYKWEVRVTSESKNLSKAAWVMIFEDGEMSFYAKRNENGREMLPSAEGNSNLAYLRAPLYDLAKYPDQQYEIYKQTANNTYWRIIPFDFVSDTVVAQGLKENVLPQEVHRYTVVVWLEGDDPDCTTELIGGHLGLDVYLEYVE